MPITSLKSGIIDVMAQLRYYCSSPVGLGFEELVSTISSKLHWHRFRCCRKVNCRKEITGWFRTLHVTWKFLHIKTLKQAVSPLTFRFLTSMSGSFNCRTRNQDSGTKYFEILTTSAVSPSILPEYITYCLVTIFTGKGLQLYLVFNRHEGPISRML